MVFFTIQYDYNFPAHSGKPVTIITFIKNQLFSRFKCRLWKCWHGFCIEDAIEKITPGGVRPRQGSKEKI